MLQQIKLNKHLLVLSLHNIMLFQGFAQTCRSELQPLCYRAVLLCVGLSSVIIFPYACVLSSIEFWSASSANAMLLLGDFAQQLIIL